jgi:NAD(P)-dependent dehydrogenase (short-subunit alcohol dehydrogenase family)
MTDYLKNFNLTGKVAVVCGGLGLIGKEISNALMQAGADTIVLDVDDKKGSEFEEQSQQKNQKIKFIHFDTTDFETYDDIVSQINKEFGKIDIWVNTAYPRTKDWGNKLEDVTLSSWNKNVEMQQSAYCFLTKMVAESMKKKNVEGSIINMSSIYGVVAPNFSIYPENMTSPAAYSAIKAAIISFSKYCASYYGSSKIRVNTICPGGIFDNQNETFVKKYLEKTPLGRMGLPEDIAAATLFLASPASSYITGQSLMVDGGWTIL